MILLQDMQEHQLSLTLSLVQEQTGLLDDFSITMSLLLMVFCTQNFWPGEINENNSHIAPVTLGMLDKLQEHWKDYLVAFKRIPILKYQRKRADKGCV